MRIRAEQDADRIAVRALVVAAFAREPGGEPIEAPLVDRMRARGELIPELSLVALTTHGPAGYVACSRGRVDDQPVVGLGPLAVLPELQGQGIGTALMRQVLDSADAMEEAVVVLLGDGRYYSRFGFRPARELGIASPVQAWGDALQARAPAGARPSPRGTFRFSSAFDDL